jgi:antitoxin (DNA-binding transcriptional repressor) of toxin-antitoxin stability system
MTIQVDQQEARERVLQGEEIIISVEGIEMARLIPSKSRVPGIDKGCFVVPDNFDDPLPSEIIKAFEGEN